MTDGIGKEMAKGAAWMIGMRLSVRFIGLISTIILARLLRPEDFGLVALASSVVGMIDVLSNFSFDMALIREGQARRSHYDTVFTLSITRGLIIALVLGALAEPAAHFFRDTRVAPVVYVLALGSVLEGFQNVGIVDFRKNMTFGLEFAFTTAIKVLSFGVTVIAALIWRQYWALVAGILAGRAAGVVLSYRMHPYRPRISFAEWHELFHFSKWLLVSNLASFLSNRLDSFIIGRLSGMHVLGLYDVSSEIATLPTAELVAPIQRALYPGYAKVVSQRSDLAKYYASTFAMIFALALPAGIGIAVLPKQIIELFLGPNWLEAVPLLQILSFVGIFAIGSSNSASLLIALGRARAISFVLFAKLLCLGPLLVVGIVYGGAVGAAWAVAVASLVTLILSVGMALRALSLSFKMLIGLSWRSAAAGGLMATSVHLLVVNWIWTETNVMRAAQLMSAVALGAGAYAAAHLLLWRLTGRSDGPERALFATAGTVFGRWFGFNA